MQRDLSSEMATALEAGLLIPGFLVMLELKTKTEYIWTGAGNLVWDGMTFIGIGDVGEIGTMKEGSEVRADGMTIGLSGINLDLLGETLTDVQVGATAKVWLGFFLPGGGLVGTPFLQYSGTVDEPEISPGAEKFSIMLKLEGRMLNLQRPTGRRYTAADQRIEFPDDTAFDRVELMNNLALRWGH